MTNVQRRAVQERPLFQSPSPLCLVRYLSPLATPCHWHCKCCCASTVALSIFLPFLPWLQLLSLLTALHCSIVMLMPPPPLLVLHPPSPLCIAHMWSLLATLCCSIASVAAAPVLLPVDCCSSYFSLIICFGHCHCWLPTPCCHQCWWQSNVVSCKMILPSSHWSVYHTVTTCSLAPCWYLFLLMQPLSFQHCSSVINVDAIADLATVTGCFLAFLLSIGPAADSLLAALHCSVANATSHCHCQLDIPPIALLPCYATPWHWWWDMHPVMLPFDVIYYLLFFLSISATTSTVASCLSLAIWHTGHCCHSLFCIVMLPMLMLPQYLHLLFTTAALTHCLLCYYTMVMAPMMLPHFSMFFFNLSFAVSTSASSGLSLKIINQF